MNYFKYLSILMLTLMLSACGGGGNNSLTGNPTGGASAAASIQILRSSPQLLSDQSNGSFVTITAYVRDAGNNLLPAVPVTFSADTGSLQPIDSDGNPVAVPETSDLGIAQARLFSLGNVQNRTITVTVTSGNISGQITVAVVGTALQLTGPAGIAQGDPANLNLLLTDGQGQGISGQVIALTSQNGNSLSNANPVTGANGGAQVVLTADGTNTLPDVVSATALGITTTLSINVSNDSFAFTSPAAGTEVMLTPSSQTLTIEWLQGGAVPNGSEIEVSTTFGSLSAGTITTTGGVATVDASSPFAGNATISATGVSLGGTPIANGPSTSITIEFVATVPDAINVVAFPDTVVIGEQTAITATVRDAAGNPVKNINVDFTITADTSGGVLSVPSDKTDSQGVARVFYTGGLTTTPKDGVEITARARNTLVSNTVNLTVAGQAVNFVIGSGNELFEVSDTRFGMPWSVTVTDVTGAPIANSELRLGIRSLTYGKGFWQVVLDPIFGEIWARGTPYYPGCPDEDAAENGGNENGSLDLIGGVPGTGEDFNSSGALEAGNIATIVAANCEDVSDIDIGSSQQTLLTDGAGAVEICVVYPQDYNTWVDVKLTATVPVGGTENNNTRKFQLPGLADDFNDTNKAVPGVISPFGTNACTAPD